MVHENGAPRLLLLGHHGGDRGRGCGRRSSVDRDSDEGRGNGAVLDGNGRVVDSGRDHAVWQKVGEGREDGLLEDHWHFGLFGSRNGNGDYGFLGVRCKEGRLLGIGQREVGWRLGRWELTKSERERW